MRKKATGKINVSETNQLHIDSASNILPLPADTTLTIGHHTVSIKTSGLHTKGDILMLPGWNFSKDKTCNETSFCKRALAEGYRLILPEMLKSTYATHYFPETRNDYRAYPTLTWVIDTLIPELKKKFGIFSGNHNILYGISTGAKGAALIHLRTDTLFQKVILLSGDYDQTQNPTDNLMINTYGPYSIFRQRWKEMDNPTNEINKWKAKVYIAHGLNDKIVSSVYSIHFADTLKKTHHNLSIELHLNSLAGHDYTFWEHETERIMEFIKQ